MNWIFNHLIAIHVDVVTGIAVVTLLFMMLQTEHERCDRVRAGWTEVRRATLKVTSAIQRAEQRRASPDAQPGAPPFPTVQSKQPRGFCGCPTPCNSSKHGGLDSATIGNMGVGSPKIPTLAKTARMGHPSFQNHLKHTPPVRAEARTALRYGVGFFAGAGAGAGLAAFGAAGAGA